MRNLALAGKPAITIARMNNVTLSIQDEKGQPTFVRSMIGRALPEETTVMTSSSTARPSSLSSLPQSLSSTWSHTLISVASLFQNSVLGSIFRFVTYQMKAQESGVYQLSFPGKQSWI